MDASSLVVGLVECPSLRLFEQFLGRRGYRIARPGDPAASILVVCADHLHDAAVLAAGTAFVGPKLVLGAEPPAGWFAAERLNLPLLPLDLEGHLQRRTGGGAVAATGYSVLVVEDDPFTSATLCRTLGDAGFAVRACPGFSEVARQLAQKPDFIVMDLNLPGLSGEKLGEIIRVKRIPVAIFSSEPAARLEEARTRIGAVAAFPKDTALGEMARWIREYLDKHKRVGATP